MAAPPVFLEHSSSLAHDTGDHPECGERILAIAGELAGRGWVGFERVESPEIKRSELTAVHPSSYVQRIEEISLLGGGALDPDTVINSGSFDAAIHSAGGAVRLAEMLVAGEAPTGFSVHRPPGHHAGRERAMGFCLFNNIALAARHAIDSLGLSRVMIFDWDVHHGNGTSDIFWESPEVLFVSIHQAHMYPGTGTAAEVGGGAGRGFTVNLPVPAGADDALWLALVTHIVVPLARSFEPQLVLISAGYDAHRDDPLGDCELTESGFAAMTASIAEACAAVGAPLGCVLEGGYDLRALASSVAATMQVLGGVGAGAVGARAAGGGLGAGGARAAGGALGAAGARAAGDRGAPPELVRAALDRLQEFWPGLSR